MPTTQATAISHPNIAFIKYWGNVDHNLRIPVNGSISMNLAGLETHTTVTFDTALQSDQLTLNDSAANGAALERVSAFLDHVRALAGIDQCARVTSENNFPAGAGIASSSSAFAALALAATTAAGLSLDTAELSRIARRGSGSASRSVPGGFVEWYAGSNHKTSFAESIAPADHWALNDCVAIVSKSHKATGSTEGHTMAPTSSLQDSRVAGAPARLDAVRQAILERDFSTFASIVELDSNMMHAVMMTSQPPLIYWQPATLAIMQAVGQWRHDGLNVCYTIDAGPNVHVICTADHSATVQKMLAEIPGVLDVLHASAGGPARLLKDAT